MALTIDCSYHQRDDAEPKQEEIMLDTIDHRWRETVKKYLERKRWVVQFNGDYMDTYCSKKCAR